MTFIARSTLTLRREPLNITLTINEVTLIGASMLKQITPSIFGAEYLDCNMGHRVPPVREDAGSITLIPPIKIIGQVRNFSARKNWCCAVEFLQLHENVVDLSLDLAVGETVRDRIHGTLASSDVDKD
jgi:hypothetical protein